MEADLVTFATAIAAVEKCSRQRSMRIDHQAVSLNGDHGMCVNPQGASARSGQVAGCS